MTAATGRTVTFLNGSSTEVTTVVWAPGTAPTIHGSTSPVP